MRRIRVCQCLAVLLTGALAISPSFASRSHRAPTAGHSHSKRKAAVHQIHGQRQIDTGRAREIQSALIRENYLTGEPTGDWDQQSQDAMRSYQAAHNWQTKIIPDSRALITLGLGPTVDGGSVTAAAGTQVATPPASSEASKPAERSRNASKALTLADAHSILN